MFKKLVDQSLDEEVTPRNYIIVLDDLAPCHIGIGSLAERTSLLKVDHPLPLHWVTAKLLPFRTKRDFIASTLDDRLAARSSAWCGTHCDILPSKHLRNQLTGIVRNAEIAPWAAFVGPSHNRISKAVLLCEKDTVYGGTELLIQLFVAYADGTGRR